jgi:UDP-glucose:(heptosyl)LPS alpha-1,3-glucosyltransferase
VNVGIVVHRYDASEGTGGYVVELLPRIAEAHEVTLYAARIAAPVPQNVRVIEVPAWMRKSYTAILTFPTAFRAVRKPHDLLHVQGWVAPSADIVTAHIVMAAWRAAARDAGVTSPAGERYLGGLVQNREAALFRAARHVIAPSTRARHDIEEHYTRSEDLTVIHHGFPRPHGVPDRADARRTLGLPETTIIALFVGDIRKGLHVALEAVAHTPEVHLAVVSHSPGDEVLHHAHNLGVTERVYWIGSLTHMSTAYAAADLLLHPTMYDSFGLVVAEAMAHGVPPIVTKAAGITELMVHGESGWLVGHDVTGGTQAAVRELAKNEPLRNKLAAGARAAAQQRSWDDVARETLALYDQVAAR